MNNLTKGQITSEEAHAIRWGAITYTYEELEKLLGLPADVDIEGAFKTDLPTGPISLVDTVTFTVASMTNQTLSTKREGERMLDVSFKASEGAASVK